MNVMVKTIYTFCLVQGQGWILPCKSLSVCQKVILILTSFPLWLRARPYLKDYPFNEVDSQNKVFKALNLMGKHTQELGETRN